MSGKPNDSISVITIPFILLAAAVFLFSGLLRMERDMVLFTSGIIGLIGVIRIWSGFSLNKLECRFGSGTRSCFRGDTFMIEAWVFNRKLLPVITEISLPSEPEGFDYAEGQSNSAASGLLWYQQAELEWQLTAEKRGIHQLGPVTVSGGDFFGFYKKERPESVLELTVYPRILPVKLPGIQAGDLFGKAGKKSPVQDPVYILGTREYQHWQPARNIHWKASARYSRLMEKIFDPSEQEKVVLAFDAEGFDADENGLLFEKAIETAASVLYEMDRRGYIIGFATNSELKHNRKPIVRPGRNISHITEMLETMAAMETGTAYSLDELLDRVYKLNSSVSLILVGYNPHRLLMHKERFGCRGASFTGIAAADDGHSAQTEHSEILMIDDILDTEGLCCE